HERRPPPARRRSAARTEVYRQAAALRVSESLLQKNRRHLRHVVRGRRLIFTIPNAKVAEELPIHSKYDVVVIGGGHHGLVNAAYLARAGKKVLVCERRHVLGGAAVTEEVFPGFKFSVASYVVSLLRPEIIRELDLPRHGMEILPLDGTFTPMPNGDYLWRVNDHAKTRQENGRHSRLDAEAYDEYGRAVVGVGRVGKAILAKTAADAASLGLGGVGA